MKSNQLVENIHYYMENGKLVFTERFHLERGYCCGKNCRHCPYGRNSFTEKNNDGKTKNELDDSLKD